MQHFPCAPPFSRVHLNHRRGTLADERDDTDDDEKDDDDASVSLRFVLLPHGCAQSTPPYPLLCCSWEQRSGGARGLCVLRNLEHWMGILLSGAFLLSEGW